MTILALLFLGNFKVFGDAVLVSHDYINQIGHSHSQTKNFLSANQLKEKKFYSLKFNDSYYYQFDTAGPKKLPKFEMLKNPKPSVAFRELYSDDCPNSKLKWAENSSVIGKLADRKNQQVARMFFSLPRDAAVLEKTDIGILEADYKQYISSLQKKYSGENHLDFGKQDGDLAKIALNTMNSSRAYKSAGDFFVVLLPTGDFSSDQNLMILRKTRDSNWTEMENIKISGSCD